MSREFATPVVVASRCLEFDGCRYDGGSVPFRFLDRLKPFVRLEAVCPEVEIGLGVPRAPIRIYLEGERKALFQPRAQRRLTREMNAFSERFLAELEEVDGFILKGKSPSCGVDDAKIFAAPASTRHIARGAGLFADKALEKFGGLAVTDEARLRDPGPRARFLTQIFALAGFREARKTERVARLARYHAQNKLLFMAHHQVRMRAMGRLLANREKRRLGEVAASYESALRELLAHAPGRAAHVNALAHALGHFSEKISRQEKARFLEALEQYRAGEVPLAAPLATLQEWAARFGAAYMEAQTYFAPYPPALGDSSECGAPTRRQQL